MVLLALDGVAPSPFLSPYLKWEMMWGDGDDDVLTGVEPPPSLPTLPFLLLPFPFRTG